MTDEEMRQLIDDLTPAFGEITLPLVNGDFACIHPITFGRARIGYQKAGDLGFRDIW